MYLIEGNIGAGKSTFVRILQQRLMQTQVISEPVHMWHTQQAQQSLLGHFIQAPHRWAFTMETYAMMSRAKDHMHYQQYERPVILERSVYSGHYCFACNGFQQGYMTLKEWEIYMQYFYYLIPRRCKPPHGFIFLDASPDVAYQRIQKRQRSQEEGVPRAYLEQLDARHRMFLLEKRHVLSELVDVPVLHLSVEQEFAEDEDKQDELVAAVRDFMVRHG